jgi:hypothetical protein
MRRILLTFCLILGTSLSYSQTSEVYTPEWYSSLDERINFITFIKPCEKILQFRVYRGVSDNYNICIKNCSGKTVYETTLKGVDQIDISGFYQGVYFITADDGKGNYITKEIIIG